MRWAYKRQEIRAKGHNSADEMSNRCVLPVMTHQTPRNFCSVRAELNGERHGPTGQSGLTSRVNCHSDLSPPLPSPPHQESRPQSWTILDAIRLLDDNRIIHSSDSVLTPRERFRSIRCDGSRRAFHERLEFKGEKKFSFHLWWLLLIDKKIVSGMECYVSLRFNLKICARWNEIWKGFNCGFRKGRISIDDAKDFWIRVDWDLIIRINYAMI